MAAVITGSGLFTPPHAISNEELVDSLTIAVNAFNAEHQEEIAAGTVEERALPNAPFIFKASGIKSRYVMNKEGVLDPERLAPHFRTRGEDELSIQAEMAVAAITEALQSANKKPEDVDAIILGCSNLQRAYPAVAVEVQGALGAKGWAYDMNVACSSATFSIQAAVNALETNAASCVVVVNPEITSGHNNFHLRDFHFIFGDAATALVLERKEQAAGRPHWEVLGTKLATKFSNNIRNDHGFLNAHESPARGSFEVVFRQNGSRVFREVCPLVAEHITEHLRSAELEPTEVNRFWLHQANMKMNLLICKGILGRLPEEHEAPTILDTYANTSSAGSIIAFHKHSSDMAEGSLGVICSFGAGYSVGSVIVRKHA